MTYKMVARLAVLCVYVCSCIFILSTPEVTTEQTKWGNVRPPRVLAINDTIYVHVVPHTHDDVGWLETVDEYYYGGRIVLFILIV